MSAAPTHPRPEALRASPDAATLGDDLSRLINPRVMLVAAVFYALAALAPLTPYDAPAFAVLVSWTVTSWAPCLLVLLLSVHDAPGMATPSLYLGVAGVGLALARVWLLGEGRYLRTAGTIRTARVAALAVLTILYGVAISFWQDSWGDFPQSIDRHYLVVGVLAISMVVIAQLAGNRFLTNPAVRRDVATACLVALVHVLVISSLQYKFGPTFGASLRGMNTLSEDVGLVDPGAGHAMRLTGPFLTPNNLGSVPAALLLLLAVSLHAARTPIWFLYAYVLIGGGVSLLGMSRSMLGYYVATTGLLCWSRFRGVAIALFGSLALGGLWLGIDRVDFASMTRLENYDFFGSTRALLWTTTLDTLDRWDWVRGIGMTSWDAIFAEVYRTSRISDPHNWVLAIAGAFGVVGLWFYWRLFRSIGATLQGPRESLRAVGGCLLVFVFLRDLVAAQNILNNHPSVCLNWLLICVLLGSSVDSSATNNRSRRAAKGSPPLARQPGARPRGAQHPQQQRRHGVRVRGATRRAGVPESGAVAR